MRGAGSRWSCSPSARLPPLHPAARRLRRLLPKSPPSTSSTPITGPADGSPAGGCLAAGGDLSRHRRPPPLVGPAARRLARRIDLTAGRLRPPSSVARPGGPACRSAPRLGGAPLRLRRSRFRPIPRAEARRRWASTPMAATALPGRPGPAREAPRPGAEVAELVGAELFTTGAIDPARMPDWINAAAAVLVTSDYEGFGMVASRRSPAGCRSSPPRSGSRLRSSTASRAPSAPDYKARRLEGRRHAASGVGRPQIERRRAGRMALLGADRGAHDRGLPRRSGRPRNRFVLQ